MTIILKDQKEIRKEIFRKETYLIFLGKFKTHNAIKDHRGLTVASSPVRSPRFNRSYPQ